MRENLYLNNGLVIINYNAAYPRSEKGLLASPEFANVLRHYIDYAKEPYVRRTGEGVPLRDLSGCVRDHYDRVCHGGFH